MAYETLIDGQVGGNKKPANKPNYTPAKTLKQALKLLGKVFKKSAQPKHEVFFNESVLEQTFATEECPSDEECDNYANERLEAAATTAATVSVN